MRANAGGKRRKIPRLVIFNDATGRLNALAERWLVGRCRDKTAGQERRERTRIAQGERGAGDGDPRDPTLSNDLALCTAEDSP